MTQVANPSRISDIAALAAYNALVQEPLVRAFVTADGYVDLPLIFDHDDVIKPLIAAALHDTLQNSFHTLQEFLFPDIPGEEPRLCEENFAALKHHGINAVVTFGLRNYISSEMVVLASSIGKLVIG